MCNLIYAAQLQSNLNRVIFINALMTDDIFEYGVNIASWLTMQMMYDECC